jgi:hypothetical protein
VRPINPTLGSEPLRASRISSINTLGKSWDSVLFQQGKSVLDFDLNVQQRILKEQMSELARIFITSGWAQTDLLSYNNTTTSLIVPISRVNIFGTFARIAQYDANNGISDTSYSIPLSGSTETSAIFVWLEVWFQEIVPDGVTEKIDGSTNTAIENKSSIVYGYGNPDASAVIANETKDPIFGAETTRRIQIRWRLRQKAAQNPSTYNKGFANVSSADGSITASNSAILARGGMGIASANGVTGFTFLRADQTNILAGIDYNYYFTSEPDRNFWIAGDGTAADALALNTVDGRVYAVPVCYIYNPTSPTIVDLRDLATSVIPVWGVSFDSNPTGFSISSGTVPKTLSINDDLDFTGSGGTNFIFPDTDGTLALKDGDLGDATAGNVTVTTLNGLTVTENTTGFTIGGGSSLNGEKSLTINKNMTLDITSNGEGGTITFPSGNGTVAFKNGSLGDASADSINGVQIESQTNGFYITSGSVNEKTLYVGNTMRMGIVSGGSESGSGESILFPSGNGTVAFKNGDIGTATGSLGGVTPASLATGFTLTGGTTSKVFQIDDNIRFDVTGDNNVVNGQVVNTILFPSGSGTVAFQGSALGDANAGDLTATSINGLVPTEIDTGFTLAGGSNSEKTLQISNNMKFAVSASEGTVSGGSVGSTITFPTGSSTVVDTSTAQVLTNKTFTDSLTYFQDDVTNTKKMQFQLSGIDANTTRTLTVPNKDGTIAVTADLLTVGKVIALAMVFG